MRAKLPAVDQNLEPPYHGTIARIIELLDHLSLLDPYLSLSLLLDMNIFQPIAWRRDSHEELDFHVHYHAWLQSFKHYCERPYQV